MTSLELGTHFLGQSFLEKRIDGLKLVSDVATHCLSVIRGQPSGTQQTSSVEQKLQMVNSLALKLASGGKVLFEIFSKERTHSQLVQRSEQVLRLLMAKEMMT